MMHRQDELNMMFEAIDDESRRYVLVVLRTEYERANKSRRPRLRLVDRQALPDVTNNNVNPLSAHGPG
jgi:hypothetical protein